MAVKVPITLWVHLDVDVGDMEDAGRFYIEENHCIENHVHQLVREMEDADAAFHAEHPEVHESTGVCILCARGGAILGTHDLGAILGTHDPHRSSHGGSASGAVGRRLRVMSREDYVKSLGTTCDWPIEDDTGGHRCGLPAPFAGADGPVDVERWEKLCAHHVAIAAVADLHGVERARFIEEMTEQWANMDRAP